MHDGEPGKQTGIYDWQAQGGFDRPITPEDIWGFETAFRPEPPLEHPTIPMVAVQRIETGDNKHPNRHRIIKHLGFYAATLTATLGIMFAIDRLSIYSAEQYEGSGPVPCVDPSPQDLRQVNKLLNSGGGVDEVDAGRQSGVHLLTGIHTSYSNVSTATRQDVKAVLATANTELEQDGLKIEDVTPQNSDDLFFGFQNPTQRELSRNLDSSLNGIVEPLAALPIELVRMTGLKNILLMDNPASKYITYSNDQTLVWNIGLPTEAHEMTRALYQGLDATECGTKRIDHDPFYADLNGLYIYGPLADRQGLQTLEQFISAGGDTYVPGLGVERQVVVTDQDGFESVSSDKADLGSFLLDPDDYSSILNPVLPVLEAKSKFLLARLYMRAPAIVRYLAATARQ